MPSTITSSESSNKNSHMDTNQSLNSFGGSPDTETQEVTSKETNSVSLIKWGLLGVLLVVGLVAWSRVFSNIYRDHRTNSDSLSYLNNVSPTTIDQIELLNPITTCIKSECTGSNIVPLKVLSNQLKKNLETTTLHQGDDTSQGLLLILKQTHGSSIVGSDLVSKKAILNSQSLIGSFLPKLDSLINSYLPGSKLILAIESDEIAKPGDIDTASEMVDFLLSEKKDLNPFFLKGLSSAEIYAVKNKDNANILRQSTQLSDDCATANVKIKNIISNQNKRGQLDLNQLEEAKRCRDNEVVSNLIGNMKKQQIKSEFPPVGCYVIGAKHDMKTQNLTEQFNHFPGIVMEVNLA